MIKRNKLKITKKLREIPGGGSFCPVIMSTRITFFPKQSVIKASRGEVSLPASIAELANNLAVFRPDQGNSSQFLQLVFQFLNLIHNSKLRSFTIPFFFPDTPPDLLQA